MNTRYRQVILFRKKKSYKLENFNKTIWKLFMSKFWTTLRWVHCFSSINATCSCSSSRCKISPMYQPANRPRAAWNLQATKWNFYHFAPAPAGVKIISEIIYHAAAGGTNGRNVLACLPAWCTLRGNLLIFPEQFSHLPCGNFSGNREPAVLLFISDLHTRFGVWRWCCSGEMGVASLLFCLTCYLVSRVMIILTELFYPVFPSAIRVGFRCSTGSRNLAKHPQAEDKL